MGARSICSLAEKQVKPGGLIYINDLFGMEMSRHPRARC